MGVFELHNAPLPLQRETHLHHGRTHLGSRTGGKMVCTLLLVTKTQCGVLAPVMVQHTTTQIAHLATYGCMVTACPPRSYLRQGAKQAGVPSYAPPGSASYQLSSLGGVTYQRKYQESGKKLVWGGVLTTENTKTSQKNKMKTPNHYLQPTPTICGQKGGGEGGGCAYVYRNA